MAHPKTTADVLRAFANALAVAEQGALPGGAPPLSQGLLAFAQSLPDGGPPLPAAALPGVAPGFQLGQIPMVVQQFFRAAGVPAMAEPAAPAPAPSMAAVGVATRGSL
jgi:hypothetical protein